MLWKSLFIGSVAASSVTFASVQEIIDGTHPISVDFSISSHNRIAVADGAVEKVFGDSAIFSVTVDPVTGNAFVNLLKEIEGIPATMSVVTSSGLVQDLLVSSREGVSEQVILKEREEQEFFARDVTLASSVDVLNKILEGKIPNGYGQMETVQDLSLPNPLKATAIKAFEGPFEIISVYEIVNSGKESIVLSTEALKQGKGTWAFVTVNEIAQNEKAICLVGKIKDESVL